MWLHESQGVTNTTRFCMALSQAEAHQEAKRQAEEAARKLEGVQSEKATLAEQLIASTAMVTALKQELVDKGSQLSMNENAEVGAQHPMPPVGALLE